MKPKTNNEPKTLKDLHLYEGIYYMYDKSIDEEGTDYFIKKMLKAEAVKWVKKNKGEINIADWIRFFNIEEKCTQMLFNEEDFSDKIELNEEEQFCEEWFR